MDVFETSSLLGLIVRKHDLATIFYFAMMWASVQLIIWLVGRDSLENDAWRSAALALVSVVLPGLLMVFSQSRSAGDLIGGALVIFLIVWIVSGFLYEPELKQRVIITLAVSALAIVMLPLAFWLRNRLMDGIAA